MVSPASVRVATKRDGTNLVVDHLLGPVVLLEHGEQLDHVRVLQQPFCVRQEYTWKEENIHLYQTSRQCHRSTTRESWEASQELQEEEESTVGEVRRASGASC